MIIRNVASSRVRLAQLLTIAAILMLAGVQISAQQAQAGVLIQADGYIQPYTKPGKVIGPAVFGPVTAVGESSLTVLTERGEVTVQVDVDTGISASGLGVVGLEAITIDPPTRVAVLVDHASEGGGLWNEPVPAIKITVIPSKSTRKHRRVVVSEKEPGDKVKVVASTGEVFRFVPQDNLGFAAQNNLGLEKGDNVVLLVQRGAGGEERIKAKVDADSVQDRLERMVQAGQAVQGAAASGQDAAAVAQGAASGAVQGAAGSGQDAAAVAQGAASGAVQSGQVSGLIGLLRQHHGAEENRLQQTLDNAPEGSKNVVGQTVQRLVKTRNAAKVRLRERGREQDEFECILSLLGRVPATRDELAQDERRRVDTECTGAQAGGPVTVRVSLNTEPIPATGNASLNTEPIPATGNASLNPDGSPLVEFNRPADGADITQGQTILLRVNTTGGVQVESLVFTVNGVVAETITNLAEFTGLEFPVPAGTTSIIVQAGATAGGKEFTFDSLRLKVKQDPPPTVSIVSPGEGELIIAAIAMPIIVGADDNSEVTSVQGVLTVDGEVTRLAFEHTADLPGMDWRTVASIPAGSSSVAIEVTVTDNLGNRATATRSFNLAVDPPPTVRIVGPSDRARIVGPSDRAAWKVEEGESFPIVIQAEDNGQVQSVDLIINGEAHSATLSDGNWVFQATAPQGPPLSDEKSTTAPPQIYVGTVSIGGTAAPDGTVVTAWIGTAPDSILTVEVKATDDHGGTAIAHQEIQVVSRPVQVSEATVKDGGYALLVHLRVGHVFSGQVVSFRVGGVLAQQTAQWQQGGADEVNFIVAPSD